LAVNHGVISTTSFHEVQDTLATLVFDGVFERFPDLRIVSAENDVGWFPHFIHRMDHFHERLGEMAQTRLPLRPGEYLRRQVWATFQDDPTGPATYQLFGEDDYMWASDFPHSDSTFPHSREYIEKNFTRVLEGGCGER
jgi:predicted TIM-barrel fold metal-dependent hydrolase